MAILPPIEVAKFWSRVDCGPDFQCWPWNGAKNAKGYGRCHGTVAHRLAYSLAIGPIPDGQVLRHKCDNPSCCNPKHLVPGTQSQNMSDMRSRDRHTRGERSGRSKLTEAQAQDILRNPQKLKLVDLAKKYSVSKATVSLIRSGERWGHLAR